MQALTLQQSWQRQQCLTVELMHMQGGDYDKAFNGAPSQTGGETPGASKRRRI